MKRNKSFCNFVERKEKGASYVDFPAIFFHLYRKKKRDNRDFKTMLSMAKSEEELYQKYLKIMDAYEKGELLGQEAHTTDTNGGLKAMKVYYFRRVRR